MNRSPCSEAFTPGIIGFQVVAGASVSTKSIFLGPVRRSYTDARVLRQLAAAMARSGSVSGNCTSFSASPNVPSETSGPKAGPVPNAGGAPGGKLEAACASSRPVAAAPKTPSEVIVKKSLRDFDKDSHLGLQKT